MGSATTGAIVAASDVQAKAPHGGTFVFCAITGALTWIVAILIGAVVGAAAVVVAKHIGRGQVEEVPEDATDLAHTHACTGVPARAVPA